MRQEGSQNRRWILELNTNFEMFITWPIGQTTKFYGWNSLWICNAGEKGHSSLFANNLEMGGRLASGNVGFILFLLQSSLDPARFQSIWREIKISWGRVQFKKATLHYRKLNQITMSSFEWNWRRRKKTFPLYKLFGCSEYLLKGPLWLSSANKKRY